MMGWSARNSNTTHTNSSQIRIFLQLRYETNSSELSGRIALHFNGNSFMNAEPSAVWTGLQIDARSGLNKGAYQHPGPHGHPTFRNKGAYQHPGLTSTFRGDPEAASARATQTKAVEARMGIRGGGTCPRPQQQPNSSQKQIFLQLRLETRVSTGVNPGLGMPRKKQGRLSVNRPRGRMTTRAQQPDPYPPATEMGSRVSTCRCGSRIFVRGNPVLDRDKCQSRILVKDK